MKEQKYSLEQVDYMFGGVNSVSREFRIILAKVISKLPKKIVEWATENLLFISSSDEYWAFSMSKAEWEHVEGLVFLSDVLKTESEEKQTFTIAHEIAHHKLNHKSPIFSNLTTEETQKQEAEADELAKRWLS